jgi:hypothetical protein
MVKINTFFAEWLSGPTSATGRGRTLCSVPYHLTLSVLADISLNKKQNCSYRYVLSEIIMTN